MNYDVNEKVQSILTTHGLDFEIHKLPLVGITQLDADEDAGSVLLESPYFGLVNASTGEFLNTCKKGYTVSQNKEVVEMVVRGMEPFGDGLSVSKGGSINGGRKIFLQLQIDGLAKVGNDSLKRFVTVIDSNDGSTGLSVGIGDLTMSCSNEFYKFYKAGEMKMRHTVSLEAKIKALPQLIEGALAESMRLIETYKTFASTAVSKNLAHKMVNHLLGFDKSTMTKAEYADLSTRNENIMNALYDNIYHEMNSKGDNLWGLHSGVTRWTTHEKSAPVRDNGRLESSMVGTNYKTNQASLAFALEQV